jgi:hypothetical protein
MLGCQKRFYNYPQAVMAKPDLSLEIRKILIVVNTLMLKTELHTMMY